MGSEHDRKYLRINVPSGEIKVIFYDEPLRSFSNYVEIKDISIGGMGMELPDVNLILKVGMIFRRFSLFIPDEEKCVVSGIIRCVKKNNFGIEFIEIKDFELRKLIRFINNKEHEQKKKEESDIASEECLKSSENAADAEHGECPAPTETAWRILVVDDCGPVQSEYKEFLTEKGLFVLQARDGVEAVKIALEAVPDLIIMDLHMPNLNGHETTRILKNHTKTKDIPILMFTTEREKDAVVKSMKIGAMDYIIKTDDKEFVLKRIARAIESRRPR